MTTQTNPAKKPQPKLRVSFLILLGIVLVTVALILAFGVGGKFVGDYNKRNWIVSTQGTATSSANYDPHVTKTQNEYLKVVEIQEANNVDGVYEKISAGDYEYAQIDSESLGQYTINTFFFYENPEDADKAFQKTQEYLENISYAEDKEVESTETNVTLLKTVVPSEEQSNVSPGNDKVTLTKFTRESGVTVLIFMFQSTELPLSGIPASGEEFTVEKLKDYEQKVFSGEIDSCSLTPNGAIGGWYPNHECYKADL